MVEILTSSSVKDVKMFYQTELPKRGWRFEEDQDRLLDYFYPNHNGSSNYTLLIRMSVGVTENLETVARINQIVAYPELYQTYSIAKDA